MADLHKINDAINKRVGRNLVTSTIVGVLLLVVVFGSAYFVQGVFGVLAWFAAMVATRELKLAYRHGGIEVPEHGLQIAATAMILAAWFGKVSALAVVTSFVIPNINSKSETEIESESESDINDKISRIQANEDDNVTQHNLTNSELEEINKKLAMMNNISD